MLFDKVLIFLLPCDMRESYSTRLSETKGHILKLL